MDIKRCKWLWRRFPQSFWGVLGNLASVSFQNIPEIFENNPGGLVVVSERYELIFWGVVGPLGEIAVIFSWLLGSCRGF